MSLCVYVHSIPVHRPASWGQLGQLHAGAWVGSVPHSFCPDGFSIWPPHFGSWCPEKLRRRSKSSFFHGAYLKKLPCVRSLNPHPVGHARFYCGGLSWAGKPYPRQWAWSTPPFCYKGGRAMPLPISCPASVCTLCIRCHCYAGRISASTSRKPGSQLEDIGPRSPP